MIAPAMTAAGARKGKLMPAQFDVDENGCVRTCPMGRHPVSVSRNANKPEARFEGTVAGLRYVRSVSKGIVPGCRARPSASNTGIGGWHRRCFPSRIAIAGERALKPPCHD